MKVAIYVEGITEVGFVYRLIGEKHQWDWTAFRMECLHLDPEKAGDDLSDYGDENSEDNYLIFDSCSHDAVSSDILSRFESHRINGFNRVVGLRDIYSDRYFELYGRTTDRQSVEKFIHDMQDTLREKDPDGFIQLRFAIMETEAWLLAMSDVFSRIDPQIDAQWLMDKACIDVTKDPEDSMVHPFNKLEEIYKSISRTYSKHWKEIKEIIFKLTWDDFDNLYHSGKCNSFREFYDSIFDENVIQSEI